MAFCLNHAGPTDAPGPRGTRMRQSTRRALQLAALATLLLVGGLVMLEGEAAAQAPVTLAVDADSTGNTARSLGSIEECISVERGATFDVDITVKSVQNLLGWEAFFVYDKSILEVTHVNLRLFQQANGRSNVINASESVPDRDGLFFMAAADVGKATDSGDGVLARLTLTGVATGISPARLPQIDFNDDDIPDRGPVLSSLTFDTVNHVGDTNGDKLFDGDTSHARIAVGVPRPPIRRECGPQRLLRRAARGAEGRDPAGTAGGSRRRPYPWCQPCHRDRRRGYRRACGLCRPSRRPRSWRR